MSKPATPRENAADDAGETGFNLPRPVTAWDAPDGARERLEVTAFMALLQNPRVEQLARLTSADPAVQGAELRAYVQRLVAGWRNAAQETRP